MKTFIVNRNTPDLAENQRRQILNMNDGVPSLRNDVLIYNCEETPFLGKLNGHYRALRENGDDSCDYYWFNHPDLSFEQDPSCLSKLLDIMEKNPEIAVISPTEDASTYVNMYREGAEWHPIATCDYLSLLIRGSVVREIGFLNPEFIYSWGAIHEYSSKVYRHGWCIAYCDIAKMLHYGGTTYGKNDTISRNEYIQNAKKFASKYFIRNYGEDWDTEFGRLLPKGVINSYTVHRKLWERKPRSKFRKIVYKFTPSFILKPLVVNANRLNVQRFIDSKDPFKLHLGCGTDKRKGWINIDIDWRVRPDIVADATKLHMIGDNVADEIESFHLLEHFTYTEAVEALNEWYRVLKPGGKLTLELPDFKRCIETLCNRNEPFDWYDAENDPPEKYALGGIYGWIPAINIKKTGEINYFQLHKYGWTFDTISYELNKIGFRDSRRLPVVQNYRPATKYNRDMRLECRK